MATTTLSGNININGTLSINDSVNQLINSQRFTTSDNVVQNVEINNSTTSVVTFSYTYIPKSLNSTIYTKIESWYSVNPAANRNDSETFQNTLSTSSGTTVATRKVFFSIGGEARSLNLFPISGVIRNNSESSITFNLTTSYLSTPGTGDYLRIADKTTTGNVSDNDFNIIVQEFSA